MISGQLQRQILRVGESLGFRRARVASVVPLDRGDFLREWLAEGRAGDMRYLHHHRKARLNPLVRYPWMRSVISAFLPYSPPPAPDPDWRDGLRGRIASYAVGRDYHEVITEKLFSWAREIHAMVPDSIARGCVDTSPVLEHEWARAAGVGWTGKHTLTLSEDRGSYAFLAELFLSVEMRPDEPVADRCGTCRACIDACPTGAIEAPYVLDPRRCISYLTIEHRGAIDPTLRPLMGPWVFGCDLCQEPCPWNSAEGPEAAVLQPYLPELLQLDPAGFEERFAHTPLERTGRARLARNAAVALGNTGNPAAVEILAETLRAHDELLTRGHAAWALGQLLPRSEDARRALEAARTEDALVREEIDAALEGRAPREVQGASAS